MGPFHPLSFTEHVEGEASESAPFRPKWFPCWFRVGARCKVRHIDIGSRAPCGWGQVPCLSTVPLNRWLGQDLGGWGPHQSRGRHILAACYTTGWEIFFILPGTLPHGLTSQSSSTIVRWKNELEVVESYRQVVKVTLGFTVRPQSTGQVKALMIYATALLDFQIACYSFKTQV